VDNMREIARLSGIEMKRPPIIPNTRKAHEATEYARDNDRLWEFHRAAFKAYWEDELNIGEVEVLADVASSCGLDVDGLREALADGRYAERIREQIEWGRAAGVTGCRRRLQRAVCGGRGTGLRGLCGRRAPDRERAAGRPRDSLRRVTDSAERSDGLNACPTFARSASLRIWLRKGTIGNADGNVRG
jgi:hypothetical protein